VPNVISARLIRGSRFSSNPLSRRVIGPAGRKDGRSRAPEAPRCAAGRGIVAALTEEPGLLRPTSYCNWAVDWLVKIFYCYRRSALRPLRESQAQALLTAFISKELA
jgi:hypothetical protein